MQELGSRVAWTWMAASSGPGAVRLSPRRGRRVYGHRPAGSTMGVGLPSPGDPPPSLLKRGTGHSPGFDYGPSVAHGVWIQTTTHPDTHNPSTSGACDTHLDEWGPQRPRED